MRNLLCAVIAFLIAVCLTGCNNGVSQEEYDKVVAERDALASSNDILTISAKGLSDMLKGSIDSKYPVISFDVEEQIGDPSKYSLDVHVSYGKLSKSDDYKNCFEKAQSDFSSILSNICKMENLFSFHFSANNGALTASVYKTETEWEIDDVNWECLDKGFSPYADYLL